MFAVFFGWAFSSYASSYIFRLPRGEAIFARHPHCGSCDTSLKTVDLFPIFSWVATWGKCRYCGARIPAVYVVLELLWTAVFAGLYWRYGFGDMFILLGFAFALLTIQTMMAIEHQYMSHAIIALFAIDALCVRLHLGQAVSDVFINGFLAFMIGMAALAVAQGKQRDMAKYKDIRQLPYWIWLLAIAGLWMPSMVGSVLFAVAWASVAGLIGIMMRRAQAEIYTLPTVMCGYAIILAGFVVYYYAVSNIAI